jgi:hypothetical protein
MKKTQKMFAMVVLLLSLPVVLLAQNASPTPEETASAKAMSLDESLQSMTEDQLAAELAKVKDPDRKRAITLALLAKAWAQDNATETKNKTAVVAMTEGQVFFGVLSEEQAQGAKDLADIVTDLYAVAHTGGSPEAALLISETGHQSTQAFLEAARKNNPLVILAPTYVPGLKVSGDVIRAIRERPLDDVKKSVDRAVALLKVRPEMMLFPMAKADQLGLSPMPPPLQKAQEKASVWIGKTLPKKLPKKLPGSSGTSLRKPFG